MMDFAESCEIYMFDQSLSSLLHWNDPEDIFDGMKWIFLVSDSYLEEMNAIAVMSSRYGAYICWTRTAPATSTSRAMLIVLVVYGPSCKSITQRALLVNICSRSPRDTFLHVCLSRFGNTARNECAERCKLARGSWRRAHRWKNLRPRTPRTSKLCVVWNEH